MNNNHIPSAMQNLVERTHKDPFFLGWALTEYKGTHKLNDEQLAIWLECSLDSLTRLSICRFPNEENEAFRKEVKRIAEFAACNSDRLAHLTREAKAIACMQEGNVGSESGLLMAARGRKEDTDNSET